MTVDNQILVIESQQENNACCPTPITPTAEDVQIEQQPKEIIQQEQTNFALAQDMICGVDQTTSDLKPEMNFSSLQPTSNRRHSTSSAITAATRQSLGTIITTASTPPPSGKHFMRSTHNRSNYEAAWNIYLKDKAIAESPSKVKKVTELNVAPGEGLLKLTKSRIYERKQWEEYVTTVKPYEDDIWWEKRRPAGFVSPKHKNQARSRFLQPTVATVAAKRDKHPIGRSDSSGSPARLHSPARSHSIHVARVDEHSNLLKPTCSSRHQQVDKDGKLLYPPPDNLGTLVLASKNTAPMATSKLMHTTESFEHSKWNLSPRPTSPPRPLTSSSVDNHATSTPPNIGGEKRSQSLSPPRGSSLSITSDSAGNFTTSASKSPLNSSRLLTFNTAMMGKQREKVIKPMPDPREVGWNQFHHKL